MGAADRRWRGSTASSCPAFAFRPSLLAVIPAAIIIVFTRNAGLLAPLTAIPVFVLSALLLRAVPPEIWDVARMRRA